MDEDFEQNYSRTAKAITRVRHDSIRLIKRIAYCERYCE